VSRLCSAGKGQRQFALSGYSGSGFNSDSPSFPASADKAHFAHLIECP
jgi:hypothetical protein